MHLLGHTLVHTKVHVSTYRSPAFQSHCSTGVGWDGVVAKSQDACLYGQVRTHCHPACPAGYRGSLHGLYRLNPLSYSVLGHCWQFHVLALSVSKATRTPRLCAFQLWLQSQAGTQLMLAMGRWCWSTSPGPCFCVVLMGQKGPWALSLYRWYKTTGRLPWWTFYR